MLFCAVVDACSSTMRKTVFNHSCCYFMMIKGASSLSPLTFETNEGVKDEVEREGGSIRLQESLGEEVSVGSPHHQETDWESASLAVLDCRGGKEDVAIHLHLSPPPLSHLHHLIQSNYPPTFSSFKLYYDHFSHATVFISCPLSCLLIYCCHGKMR